MWAKQLARRIEAVLDAILIAALLAMVVSISIQVFGRYVLRSSPGWTAETARFLMIWITMLASAAVIRRNGHISVTVIVEMLPRRIALAIYWVRDTLILILSGSLAWYGFGFAMVGARRDSPALEIPMSYPQLAIPVGGALIGVLLLLHRLSGASGDDWEKT